KEGDNLGILIMYASQYAKYNIDYRVIVEKLRQIKMPEFTSLEFEEQVNGPPVGAAINATFRSNNLNHLNTVVENLKGELAKLPGVYDLKIDDVIGDDEVFVHVDYRLADQLGLSVSDVGNTIRTALSGTIVSDVVLDNKEVNLNVKIANLDRETIDDLNDLKVMDRRGNLVPLGRIAKFEKRPGTPQIKRFDYKRARTLTGSVETQKVTSIEANALLQNKFSELRQQYPDVSLVFGGQQESTNESMESLAAAMALALLAIFCLMVFVFNSYLSPLIIMSTIPLGLVGFSVAFYFHGRPVSFLAMIGMVGLAGIIVNSGIVLISFIEQMRAEGKMTLEEILVKSSGVRLRAVVVTSLTTVSGLFPTAYGIGGSDSMLVPMTLAMAWGLTSGTLLTLLWIPCAYAILEDFKEWTARLFQKKAVAAEAPVLAAGGAHAHREEEERPREISG
ncbi:MAG: efflux RND transporter permease subunit, partial [Bdellovibrionales bacterium]|nr:efflux RND transporter permease subunit [Bdellovibrionales bacterium]